MTSHTDFSRTRAALVDFDRTVPNRAAAWEAAATPAHARACDAADRAALRAVQVAFWHDTQAINSLDNCLIAGLEFIRRCAAGRR